MIGTKTSGSPTLVSMRACTKNQKPESGLILVITYIESAMMVAPMVIRYLGWTRLDSRPVTNIITSVTMSNRIQVRPLFASKNDPFDGAKTGVAEPHVAEQSRSWRAASGEQEGMRGA